MASAERIRQRNNLSESGTAVSVMLCTHGFGCDQSMWRLLAPQFAGEFRTVSYDLVGSGRSARAAYSPSRYHSLEAYAEDLVQIIETLDYAPVIHVAHSVGCMIGLLAANRHPALFRCQIMLGPSPCYLNEPGYHGGFEREQLDELLDLMARNLPGWAGFMAPQVMANPERPELAAELEERFCRMDPQVARDFARATFLSDHRPDLPRARVPALLVQMRSDAVAPVGVGEYMHQRMPGSTLRILELGGHCPHLSHPVETGALIREYLQAC